MNYSDNPGHCRVDYFKPSGKWYTTSMIDMTSLYNGKLIHKAVKEAIDADRKGHFRGMTAVVLIPYHENEHPIMFHNLD